MTAEAKKKGGLKQFPLTYWVVIIFEFFERGAYYGVMSILSVYLTDMLGFTKTEVGAIKGTIQPLLYILPILSGAIADRMGYRKTLLVAFSLLGLGYVLTSQVTDYLPVFMFLIIMAFGAGTFKPIISGTIAKVTNESNSTLGFGIFYWSINLGAFIFPLLIVPYLKSLDWSYVLLLAGVVTGLMVIPTLFFYKEPDRQKQDNTSFGEVLLDIFNKIKMVFLDWRFILFIFIYSWFWILYFQMFDSVLWYVREFVDASELNAFVNSITGLNWSFDIEHVTVINAGTIILLQILVSTLVRNTKALPTLIIGISIGTIGMAILAISPSIWVFLIGIFLFSIGEMTAHPKFIAYLGTIAPPDKKATYMGFGFMYGFFGSLIGGFLGAWLYVKFIDNPMIAFIRNAISERNLNAVLPDGVVIAEALKIADSVGITKSEVVQYAYTSELWLVFSGIGVMCIIGLLLYQKFIGARDASNIK
ncbi:MAG: MFS transporter [Candidatus Kapabacteria bacterium]|nr:MFS transporter [Ignavibacteriota bacterium]MCW5885201.1 MFS transporter [Candidatus Kapabacteria bacterium]